MFFLERTNGEKQEKKTCLLCAVVVSGTARKAVLERVKKRRERQQKDRRERQQ